MPPPDRRPHGEGPRAAPQVRPPQPPLARHGGLPQSRQVNRRAPSEFDSARRHSARVRFLKRALPLGGLLALFVIFGSYYFLRLGIPEGGFGSVRFEEGRLVMDRPKLSGVDADRRPFSLAADRALQDPAKPARIAMENISASLPISDTGTAEIRADNGLYDADEKTLELGGGISVDTSEGWSVRLKDASIDIDSGKMHTANPVEVDTGRLRLTADSMAVEDKGKTVIFADRVQLTIMPFNDAKTDSSIATGSADRQEGSR
jgi:lipopolysaccharide export system protein LptC